MTDPELGATLPTRDTINPGLESLKSTHEESLSAPEEFFGKIAEDLYWSEKSGPVLEKLESPPFGRWFARWKTNITYNALDRHVASWRKNKVAYYWEGEDGTSRAISYGALFGEVCKFANALKKLGVRKGDRVTIYLPMIPELPVAMLATLRLGAIHSVIFAGFHAQAVADRVNDSASKLIITSDGAFRRGK